MKYDRNFFKCNKCGKEVLVQVPGGRTLACCGEPMSKLEPNTTDAAQEKHVPAVSREGNKLLVQVGSVAHPMTEEHHIAWILAAQGAAGSPGDKKNHCVVLDLAGAPKAEFVVDDGDVTVYAYCNLHGLWAADA